MSTIIIQANGLQKSFNNNRVLKGVDFTVSKGEIFALLGSNGAGKTTTINILSTLIKPDKGTATINGFDTTRHSNQVRESISLTGQFAAVDEMLSAQENLELIARLRGVDNPAKVASDLIKRFDLIEAANRRASTYSGGMMRRLDIAMSLIGAPSVIFLDEPTTGLDPEARQEVWRTIQDLAKGGTTILLTTQYLDEAEQLADKIAILHNGTIIANGTFEELKKLLPPAKKEYIEKQPTLEEIFFAITSKGRTK